MRHFGEVGFYSNSQVTLLGPDGKQVTSFNAVAADAETLVTA